MLTRVHSYQVHVHALPRAFVVHGLPVVPVINRMREPRFLWKSCVVVGKGF